MVPRQRTLQTAPASIDDSCSSYADQQQPLVSLSASAAPKVVKPALDGPSPEETAKRQHDLFNLVALLPVVLSSLINWDFDKVASGYGPIQAWSGHYFAVHWVITSVYFLTDLCWVAAIPTCVKSPGVIIKHHIAAMIYMFAPIIFPEFRCFMGALLSVEINTWTLIFRRILYKNRENISPWLMSLVSCSFYATWIIIRCMIYPAVMFEFLRLAYEAIVETGQLFHWPMVFIPVHFSLCVLNIKWTIDLFTPIFKKFFGKTTETSIASGL